MALTTMTLKTRIEKGFRTVVTADNHEFVIDQPKPGGIDEAPNPLEYFLSSIGGCICAVGRIIANQQRIKLKSIEATVSADIDKAFLMGKTEDGRSGFTNIDVAIAIDADITKEEKESLLKQIQKRCPVADNILHSSNLHCTLV